MGEAFQFNFLEVNNENENDTNHLEESKSSKSSKSSSGNNCRSTNSCSLQSSSLLSIRYLNLGTSAVTATTHRSNDDDADDRTRLNDSSFDVLRLTDDNDESTCNKSSIYVARDTLLQRVTPDASTDIIAGSYEGGLKVWECSIDLCRYLYDIYGCGCDRRDNYHDKHNNIDRSIEVENEMTVLELGCGHGLPGCLLLKQDFLNAFVLFSDFNEYVIENATMKNVQANCCCYSIKLDVENNMNTNVNENIGRRAVFAGGDWFNLSDNLMKGWDVFHNGKVCDGKFDLILAAETTYTRSAAEATAALLTKHLKYPSGYGIIANKRYYFGCGGGSDAFISAITEFSNGLLKVETIQIFDSGSGNIRELLKITWKQKINELSK